MKRIQHRRWRARDWPISLKCRCAIFRPGRDKGRDSPATYLADARLWLLDEPANGLDTDSVDQLGAALQSHLDDGGIILAASHIPLPIAFDIALQLQPLEELEACL